MKRTVRGGKKEGEEGKKRNGGGRKDSGRGTIGDVWGGGGGGGAVERVLTVPAVSTEAFPRSFGERTCLFCLVRLSLSLCRFRLVVMFLVLRCRCHLYFICHLLAFCTLSSLLYCRFVFVVVSLFFYFYFIFIFLSTHF